MAQACNPSYKRSGNWDDSGMKLALAKSLQDPVSIDIKCTPVIQATWEA
jgi:hypothetical protein